MKVYKFGGASINSVERIKNTADIISENKGEKLLVIISAMGKTTNALEKVAGSFYHGKTEDAQNLFEQIKRNHLTYLKFLTTSQWKPAESQFKEFFTEVDWMLAENPVRSFDYYYDQIVCIGELLSSTMVYHHLNEEHIKCTWIDARDVIRTDNNFRDAAIDWTYTENKISTEIALLFEEYDVIITQGFIGATDENESTTLGREGSDYSAAVFANLLSAESVTIWKDVEAVMNADPKAYPMATNIPQLSYSEVIEMAYYGAQVIHPKTIKPLQNKNIPLYVKSFIDPTLPGTKISSKVSKTLPPIIVNKEKQVLVNFKTKDFSFVGDDPVRQLYELYNTLRIKPNLTQNTAISLLSCFDDNEEKINELAELASMIFDVELERNLTLLTIRHYDEETIKRLTQNKKILLEQKTIETIQLVLR